MTLVVTHTTVTGAPADSTALVDGPAWDANHTLTGVAGLPQGGTGADLSATGGTGQVLKQASAGAAVTVGTVAASEIASGAALTRTNDTNVTLTLGGAPTTAMLTATSVTVGWAGTLAAGRGGFGADVSASSGVPLFAAGVPTFTSTTGTGNFVRATTPTLVTPVLGAATGTSLVLGGTDLTPTATNKVGVAATSGISAIVAGQDSTHGLGLVWTYNATPASATAAINTAGYSNPLTIDASTLTLQSLSSGPTTIYNSGVAPTGTGAYVQATSPTLTTPTLGAATATSINKMAITAPATSSTLAVANGKTATISNTLTFTGTDSSSIAFGAGGTIGSVGYASVGQIPGETSTGTATAGKVGERVDSSVLIGSAVALTTGTAANITSINLTAGDWEVSGVAAFIAGATTNVTFVFGSISTTSNTVDVSTPGRFSNSVFSSSGTVPGSAAAFTNVLPPTQFSLSGTTTIYLVAKGAFTISTLSAYGEIHAIRAR